MKTISNQIIAFSFMLCSINSFSQEIIEPKTVEQTIMFQATALVNSFQLDYNYSFINTYKTKPYIGFGLQYFPHSISKEKVFMVYPHVGILIGETNAFEANIGASIDFKYGEHMPAFYSGYRYHSKTTHFSFKAGLTMYYLGKSKSAESFFDVPVLLPSPTLGFGFCWQ